SAVSKLLKDKSISYVVVDDSIRVPSGASRILNEDSYAKSFPTVFTDDANDYGNLKIYKVAGDLTPQVSNQPIGTEPVGNAFMATDGSKPGQFKNPRGLAVDARSFIYVADTGNARTQ